MIRLKSCFALSACLIGFLATSNASAEEPQGHPSTSRPALRRLEHSHPAAVRQAATPMFGLRLPKIFSLSSWSAPSTSSGAISHVPRPTDCRIHCAEGPVTDRTRATTSAILAGVGGLAVVTGFVLTISKPRQPERFALAPTFRVKLSGQRAVASADWTF